jgi:hypothetical protein
VQITSNFNSSIRADANTSQSRYKQPDNNTKNPQVKHILEAQEFYDLANKYDVKNINIDETIAMSKELYNKEEITLKGHMILSFDDRSFGKGSVFQTQPDPDENYNLIEEFKTRIQLNKKLGEEQSMKNNKDILELLTKLDTLKSRNPLDIKI